jgi:hypothetical protein
MITSTDFVALVGHTAWPATVVGLCVLARNQIKAFVGALAKRVGDGRSNVSITKSGIEIKAIEAANPELANVKPEHQITGTELTVRSAAAEPAPGSFSEERNEIYKKNRGCFLVHVLEPTSDQTQEYDIFIYILRHQSTDLSIIQRAEFFFGRYWGNRVFPGQHVGGVIGVRTSAYGTFLCTCHVTFTDGEQITLSRYIDFEMGKLIQRVK